MADYVTSWTPWLVTAIVLPLASFVILSNVRNRLRRLPPGPPVVPVLGNLVWFTITSNMHLMETLRRMHERYGPVVALRFGSDLVIDISDRRLAHAVLVQSGAAVADRPFLASLDLLGHNNALTITSSNYDAHWRLLRRNFVAKMAQPAQLQLFSPAREWALADLTDKLRCRKINGGDAILAMFYHTMMCILVAMCFGEWLDEGAVRELKAALHELMIYSITNLWVFDFVPSISTRFFSGRRRQMDAYRRRLKGIYLPLINARRERRKGLREDSPTTFQLSYVDTLLEIRLKDEGNRELTDDEISGLCSEFLSAGTDIPSSALQWTMAELVKNPAIQNKLYSDIKAVTGGSGKVSPEDLHKLPYLKAVVLESLRRHPPAHQLLPHTAAEDVELSGYVIPKGATVNFMVVDFGLDKNVWDRPMEFVPERFLPGGDGELVDVTGTREIKMIPFGAGRRICPGISVGSQHLEYLVANLVSAFEWREVKGMEVDFSEMFEFSAVMKKPLEVNLVARDE